MQFLRDFLNDGPERIEARDKWVGENVMPFVPPELRQWLTVGDAINPVSDIRRAGEKARVVANPNRTTPERIGALGDVLVDSASVLAPAAAAKYSGKAAQGVVDALAMASMPADDAAQRFVADQSGAIKAWHGSPHDFDKFSLDKIGTGEGAQAYGHGLYFADEKKVAEGYRDILSGSMARNANSDRPSDIAFGAMRQFRGDREAAAEWLAQNLQDVDLGSSVPRYEQAISILRSGDEILPPGRLYEVNIDANPEDFLDWDAPLSAQPEGVRGGVRKAFGNAQPVRLSNGRYGMVRTRADGSGDIIHGVDGDTPEAARAALDDYLMSARGDDIAINMAHSRGQSPDAATNSLREAGIPGIRYLDAGSRGAGDGSRNYVVFDDRLVNVLGKDGARTTAEGKAQTVLDMLAEGRASEITDEMLDLGDPVQNARLNEYLWKNYDLPMDEASRMARADEMEFPVHKYDGESYHLTPNDVQAFNVGHTSLPDHPREAVWARLDPRTNPAAHNVGRDFNAEGTNDMPLFIRGGRAMPFEARDMPDGEYLPYAVSKEWADEARSRGYSQYELGNERISIDPTNIRSRFARFDPRLSHLRNLSAGAAGAATIGGLLTGQEAQAQDTRLSDYLNQ